MKFPRSPGLTFNVVQETLADASVFLLEYNVTAFFIFILCIFTYSFLALPQAEEKARVGVRLLGHLLRGASVRGGVQMEIIEMPLSERPVAVACCPLTGDLLVGCDNTLVLFTLRGQNQQNLVRTQLLM